MRHRSTIAFLTLSLTFLGALLASLIGAHASDDAKYPDFGGQWFRSGGGQWDPTKPQGLGQQAPLTPEYQAVFEANVNEQKAGGESYNPQARCLPGGMPRMMIAYEPIEVIVTPEITYIWAEQGTEIRRIYTDGREWPENSVLAFAGYSIGAWQGQDASGRYDTLTVETRFMKGPRVFDANGVPLHKDNQTIVKERFFIDKADPNLLHDEVTTIDHALTRPWTVTRSYRRAVKVIFVQNLCAESIHHIDIGTESYFISADGYLFPTRKDQPAPDLRFFDQGRTGD